MMQILLNHDVKQAIIKSLSPDLLEKKWRLLVPPDAPAVAGHCAIASEAFYWLAGGKEAGFVPVVCSYYKDDKGEYWLGKIPPENSHKETHWWIRGSKNGERGKGEVYDITAEQYNFPFPYQYGRNSGFMQPQGLPSKRAKIIMERVATKLGTHELQELRIRNISAYKNL